MKLDSPLVKKAKAFSLVELLGVVAAVGILASAGYLLIGELNKSISENKLQNEVATLNAAVATYLGFGGNLDAVKNPEDVIAQLRSVAKSDVADRIPGLSSSMVDPRISAVIETEEQADSDELRVVWNQTKKQFETSKTGTGITAFLFNDSDAEIDKPEDNRQFDYLYSQSDSWVWDYTETSSTSASGPTAITTYTPITIVSNLPTTKSQGSNDSEDEPDGLEPPVFSMPGGGYSIREYDLGLTLSNPNPATSSQLYYQKNYGTWEKYSTGSIIDITPDDTISAQAIASGADWTDSSRLEQSYSATPVQLNPPVIIASAPQFGVFTNRLISVALEDTNGDDPSTLEYQVGSGPWLEYEGFILLDRVDFENGVIVSAKAVSNDPYYLDSESDFDAISIEPLELAGTAGGQFHDPYGSNNMETNISWRNPTNDYFQWGTGSSGSDPSSMEFTGLENDNIQTGTRFLVGDLDYFNGTVVSGTGADSVQFALDLAFDISGSTYNTAFDYEFELINTVNTNNAWDSADYVKIDQSNSTTTFEINGLSFELVLEFGETTPNGFSNFDEFHVKEQLTASSKVYATLYDRTESTGSVDSNGNIVQDILDGLLASVGLGDDSNNGNNGNGHSNNGHGNNEDGVDSSNPGQGQGGPNGEEDPSGDYDDENGNGNGNNGNGNGNGNSGNGNGNNGNGNGNNGNGNGNNGNGNGNNGNGNGNNGDVASGGDGGSSWW